MKLLLSIVTMAALAGCGGGGGDSGPAPSAVESTKTEAPFVDSSGFTRATCDDQGGRIACQLVSGDLQVTVRAGSHAIFTNNTGRTLHIVEENAITNERTRWSEHCVYLNVGETHQPSAGQGEVGCSAKNIGEDYAPITFGAGLSVNPGDVVHLNSHTQPEPIEHIYTLKVRESAGGGQSWRQPQVDQVIWCDGQMQSTVSSPWRNNTGRTVTLDSASIYAESPQSRTRNEVASACVYVLLEGGAQKYSACNGALSRKGAAQFQAITIEPGEYLAAQASNACAAGGHWNWASYLQVR